MSNNYHGNLPNLHDPEVVRAVADDIKASPKPKPIADTSDQTRTQFVKGLDAQADADAKDQATGRYPLRPGQPAPVTVLKPKGSKLPSFITPLGGR